MDRRDFILDSAILGGSLLASRYISFGQTKQTEILAKRTLTQKTFNLGNGSKRLNAHIGHIHYQSGALKNGAMSEIDTTLNYNAKSAKYSMTNASYEAEIGLYGDVHFHNVDSAIEFALANPNRVQAEAYTGSEFGKIGKALIWKDIIDKGAHQIVECRNGSLVKIFHFDIAPKNLNALTTAKPTAEKAFVLSTATTARSLELKSASKTTFIRKTTAWNHRGESIGIELSFYLDKGGKLRAVKTLPQEFVDKTFTELGAWLECDTTTSYWAGAGDGMCQRYDGVPATWASIRAYADAMYTSRTSMYAFSSLYPTVDRIFIPIDTEGIIGNITTAILYTSTPGQAEDKTRNAVLVLTTQDDPTNLVVGDYSRLTLNSPAEGAGRKAQSDWVNIAEYYSWQLNSTGIGWINKTGYTLLGVREEWDVDNATTAPTSDSGIRLYSEYFDSSVAAYLDVTYSEGETARRKPPIVVTY
jgi:hypothetical protein